MHMVSSIQRVQMQMRLVLMVVAEVVLVQLVWVYVLGWGEVVMVLVNGWV